MGLSVGQGAAAAAAAAAVDCCLLLPAAAGCCLDSPALQLRLVRPRLPRIVPSHRPPSINLDASPPTLIPLSPSHACLSPGPELAHLHFRLPAYELLLDLASFQLPRAAPPPFPPPVRCPATAAHPHLPARPRQQLVSNTAELILNSSNSQSHPTIAVSSSLSSKHPCVATQLIPSCYLCDRA